MPPPRELPVTRPLAADFSMADAFVRFASHPGCLWLDSAAGEFDSELSDLCRYSFLSADPVQQLTASVGGPDPWPKLDAWQRALPKDFDPTLPPFQGGIAGLIGYEAATWLEQVGVAKTDDLPTPAISLGLYDWVIATDHQSGRSWIISQGFLGEGQPGDRYELATKRAEQVQHVLTSPAAPTTCRLHQRQLLRRQHPTPYEGIESNFRGEEFRGSVDEIVRRICQGDSFQVNLAQRLISVARSESPKLFMRLRTSNPAPFGSYYGGDGFEVLSTSPERFLSVRDRHVETRPIKGTIDRTGESSEDDRLAAVLRASEKDLAENTMIVDLMRNDLSRVCEDDSIRVAKLCGVERYQFVQHLVSVVEGQLAPANTVVDLLRACFPGGSITGAPKIEAMRTIAILEPHRRGPYCGSLGYIGCGGNADFNILIRTVTAAHGYWQIPVGGGITARSNPQFEEAETWAKAKGMLHAILRD